MKAPHVFAAVLCTLALVALGATALRIRSQRQAAREARSDAEPLGPAANALPRLTLFPDGTLESRGVAAGTIEEFFTRASGSVAELAIAPQTAPSRQAEALASAARHSVPVRFAVGETSPLWLTLERGRTLRVEHFSLLLEEDLLILDAKGSRCVEFRRLDPGAVRRWHELQLTTFDRSPRSLTLQVELRPGSPCFGPGLYHLVRPGLRIELSDRRTIRVVEYDPPRARLTLEAAGASSEIRLDAAAPETREGRLTFALRNGSLLIDPE